ncbi:MAG: YkgJ family cysteine cluster protein [Gelidibacter sp.]|nr:YkgJ family cysteine cluster protein [Gelidibacter sp.]
MEAFLKELPGLAKEKHQETKKYFEKLKKRTPNNLDLVVQELHNSEFKRTDCLTCGNCCKTTSPIFTEKDIQRIAKYVKMKEHHFISTYLERDPDDFYVLKTAPCSFLNLNDNRCSIYDVRPKACNEYPHTNRRKFIQLTNLTLKNTAVCPAVYNIVEALKTKLLL